MYEHGRAVRPEDVPDHGLTADREEAREHADEAWARFQRRFCAGCSADATRDRLHVQPHLPC